MAQGMSGMYLCQGFAAAARVAAPGVRILRKIPLRQCLRNEEGGARPPRPRRWVW